MRMRRRHVLGLVGATASGGCLRLVDTGNTGSGQDAGGGGDRTESAGDGGESTGGGGGESAGDGQEQEATEDGTAQSATVGTVSAGGWPMVGANPARTGHAPDNAGVADEPRVEWEVEGIGRATSPAVVDGTVFVGGGNVQALDAAAGERRWRTDFDGGGSVVAGNEAVYAGSGSGTVSALDPETGERLWATEFEANDGDVGAVTVAGGGVYVGYGETIHAVDAATGERRWAFGLGTGVGWRTAAAGGVVYAGVQDGVYALDATTGEERWTVAYDAASVPAVAGDTVYVGIRNGVRAINAADGTEAWGVDVDGPVRMLAPAVADGTVYVGGFALENPDSPATLFALDAADGTEQWRSEFASAVPSFAGISPAVVDGTVYAAGGSLDGGDGLGMVALDAADGTERWRFPVEQSPAPPAVTDSSVFVADREAGRLSRLSE
jgi:serine/threonine-protein kinase